MELPNIHFQDFPIEFKEINPDDFPNFEVSEKIIISPDERGYVSEALLDKINIEEKNTTVINAGVGNGKTYSVIELVKKYYDLEGYLIFIASPFVSLVEQYYNDIIDKGIAREDVFRYEILGNEAQGDYTRQKIHIVTANCLLGNPGEDSFINSEIKREYLNSVSSYCRDTNKKVVFIYDEIHDTIHNFKEKYIFNLWKWKNLIHKNFIISATYNEASKVVIEYLAELTDNKIQIIEAQRVRLPEKQSALFLHYNTAHFYKNNNEEIASIFNDLVNRDLEIDVLCYSKTLAESIVNDKTEGISKELYRKYDEINNCTSELINGHRQNRVVPQNRYNKDKCNVGTNFKTGVSILKDNHALVIILPPRSSRMPFQNLYGIFSTGVNSIIQALARKRKKGEIHIILPRPDEFNYESLPFSEEKRRVFREWYDNIKHHEEPKKLIHYNSFVSQKPTLEDFYINKLRVNIEDEITLVKSLERNSKVRLDYPEFKHFLLEDGEDYLSNEIPFFGGDLSAFVSYSAFTNQFVNCNLTNITFNISLFFEQGKIQEGFDKYFERYFKDAYYSLYSLSNNSLFYQEFRKDLFELFDIKLKMNNRWYPIKKGGTSKASKLFEEQLIGFIQRLILPKNPYIISTFYSSGNLVDGNYPRSQYLLESISHSKFVDLNTSNFSQISQNRVNSFKFLDRLRRKVITAMEVSTVNNETFKYLPNKPFNSFIEGADLLKFRDMMDCFLRDDFFLKLGVFEFKRRFDNKSDTKKIETLYTIILEDFFITENIRLSTGSRPNVKKVLGIKKIPNYRNVINQITPPDYNFPN